MIGRDMDDRRTDKKHRKLTRTPEVSICDISAPHPLSSSPTSSVASPGIPLPNPAITTSPSSTSSLSFSSLLSHSTSFFSPNHQTSNNLTAGKLAQSALITASSPKDNGSGSHSASEECLKTSHSSYFSGKNFDYFRLSNHRHHNDVDKSGKGKDGGSGADSLAVVIPGGGGESANKSAKQHLQIKSEELVPTTTTSLSSSSSTSAFSLKRFSSFSFNRGSSTKRNAAAAAAASKEQHHPKSETISNAKSNNNIHFEANSKKEEMTVKSKETSSPSSRRAHPPSLKASTNPFHQQSSSTSTSSSISYQFSTDNVIETIPACCLKVTPQQSLRSSPTLANNDPFALVRPLPRNQSSPTNLDDSNDSTNSQSNSESAFENTVGQKATSGINIQIKRNYHYQPDPQFDQIFFTQDPVHHHATTNPFLAETTIKRDEFLKATMRICLVVSPPSTKLQVQLESSSSLLPTLLHGNTTRFVLNSISMYFKKTTLVRW